MDARPSRKLKLLQQIGMIPSRQPRMTPSGPGMTQAKMARQYGIRTQTNGCIIARENTSKLGTANSGKMQRQGHRGGWEIDWGQSDMGNGVARRSREPAAALTAWLLVISSTETSSAFDNLRLHMYSDASGSLTQKLISFGKNQINLKSYEISPFNILTLVRCFWHYISKLGVITVEMCYGQLQ